jgi:SRSO17 transposase
MRSLPACPDAPGSLSAGSGSTGPRYYDWAWISFHPADAEDPGQRWLLIRRNNTTGELAFYHCYAPRSVPLATLVRIAGRRWTIEESFQASKGWTGLDRYQARRWVSWQRWTVLAMLAYAYFAVITATERDRHHPPAELIPLTCNEIHTWSTP